jgi:hypothetical protein
MRVNNFSRRDILAGARLRAMNCRKLQFCTSVVCATLLFFAVRCYSQIEKEWENGYHLIDTHHSLFYEAQSNQWVWGIIMPDTGVPKWDARPTNAWAVYPSGIGFQLVNNTLTITNRSKKVTIQIKQKAIYMLDSDLTIRGSENLSGLQIISKRIWTSQGEATISKPELPENIFERFDR